MKILAESDTAFICELKKSELNCSMRRQHARWPFEPGYEFKFRDYSMDDNLGKLLKELSGKWKEIDNYLTEAFNIEVDKT